MNGKYGILTCAICGTMEPKVSPTQIYCQACRKDKGKRRAYVKEQEAKELAEQAAKQSLKGLTIVQIDLLAKELHTSYGKLVAGHSEEQMKRALGAGTPRAR